jgi:hypothetical protein
MSNQQDRDILKQHIKALDDYAEYVSRLNKALEQSFNVNANYREMWQFLLTQTWFLNHLPEIRKRLHSMVSIEPGDNYYNLPKED